MRERRAVHMPMTIEMIEALRWEGFRAIAETARQIAEIEGWPDAETAAERLEWRHTDTFPSQAMIITTFQVMDR